MNHVYTDFVPALQIGKYNESIIAHEFEYQGIPLIQTEGKNDYDFFLPDGRSLEVKLDLRSQATGSGCIEYPTLQRCADLYLYTFTFAKVFTGAELEALYSRGKIVNGGAGDRHYDARYVWQMGRYGTPLHEFIKALKQQQ